MFFVYHSNSIITDSANNKTEVRIIGASLLYHMQKSVGAKGNLSTPRYHSSNCLWQLQTSALLQLKIMRAEADCDV